MVDGKPQDAIKGWVRLTGSDLKNNCFILVGAASSIFICKSQKKGENKGASCIIMFILLIN